MWPAVSSFIVTATGTRGVSTVEGAINPRIDVTPTVKRVMAEACVSVYEAKEKLASNRIVEREEWKKIEDSL